MNLVTTDSWREWCDAVFWCDKKPHRNMAFRGGDIVFCKIDEVLRFFESLRLTRKKIILVTGEGDLPCDDFRQTFLPANVHLWFATNVIKKHPRVKALPLGLGSPSAEITLRAADITAYKQQNFSRANWLYVNFRPDTNVSVRSEIFEYFQCHAGVDNWITFQKPSQRGNNTVFLDALVRHRFVLCPPGNGRDTHRIWEVLLAGAIPIVLRSQAMEEFLHLPILFVNNFQDVTKELLENAFAKIPMPSNLPMEMFSHFWGEKIHAEKKQLASCTTIKLGQWTRESATYGMAMLRRRL